jgi:CheY-like chemotaxis protein
MPESQAFSWKNARILIADDEPDMREIFAAWFRSLGCSVTEVADGKDALDALKSERFDAIVTDVRMPRVNGVELVHQLHQSGHYIPIVIFVSGYVDLTLPDAFNLGVEALMSKPCEKKELINAVKRSLLRRQLIFEPSLAPLTVDPPARDNYIHESYSSGVQASEVALGRGGISLNIPHHPVPDSAIGFSLSFTEEPLTELTGWGVLRWCEHLPRGSRVGVEFLYLEPRTLDQFARWLEENSPVSFIPKGPHSRSTSAVSS